MSAEQSLRLVLRESPSEPVGPRSLPCAHWCLICQDIDDANPCAVCHDCNSSLAAADDATWD